MFFDIDCDSSGYEKVNAVPRPPLGKAPCKTRYTVRTPPPIPSHKEKRRPFKCIIGIKQTTPVVLPPQNRILGSEPRNRVIRFGHGDHQSYMLVLGWHFAHYLHQPSGSIGWARPRLLEAQGAPPGDQCRDGMWPAHRHRPRNRKVSCPLLRRRTADGVGLVSCNSAESPRWHHMGCWYWSADKETAMAKVMAHHDPPEAPSSRGVQLGRLRPGSVHANHQHQRWDGALSRFRHGD